MHYLDHAATTPLDPAVGEAYLWAATHLGGNPSALHTPGRAARSLLEDARESIARSIGCDSHEVIFTSGGTEADHLALSAWSGEESGAAGTPVSAASASATPATPAASAPARHPRHAFSAVEHPAVAATAQMHRERGPFEIATIPVTHEGALQWDSVAELAAGGVVSLSVMAANNETGVLTDLAALRDIVGPQVQIHTDAVQAVALEESPWPVVDAMSISGHKIGAPVGIGALIARRGYTMRPLWGGGGQERKLRSGTINAAGAWALATALTLAGERREANRERLGGYRDNLAGELLAAIPDAFITGGSMPRLPSHLHLTIPEIDTEALLLGCDMAGIALSLGSACHAGVQRPSAVTTAMGISEPGVRITFGHTSTEDDWRAVARELPAIVETARRAYRRRRGKEGVCAS